MNRIQHFVFYFVYWTMVFGVACWFVHDTWPFGLAAIPLGVANTYLVKWERARQEWYNPAEESIEREDDRDVWRGEGPT